MEASLRQEGIGAKFSEVVGAINEMRAAIQKDDGEGFGKAAAKLLGEPQKDAQADPRITELQTREAAVRAEAQKAQTDVYKFRSEKSGQAMERHIAEQIKPLLGNALPKSVSDSVRNDLQGKIKEEIMAQLGTNAYLLSQVGQLIGPTGKMRLEATEADWKAAGDLIVRATTPAVVRGATRKVVEAWSKSFVASNKAAITKAKGGTVRQDVSGSTKTSSGKKGLTLADLEGPNAKSDKDILDSLV